MTHGTRYVAQIMGIDTAGNYSELVASRKAEDIEYQKELDHLLRHSRYTTEAQITFRDAAQAAAIGTAAGLTGDQLTRLGKAAKDASAIYAKNIFNFLSLLIDKENKKLNFDLEDEIINSVLLTYNGQVRLEQFK